MALAHQRLIGRCASVLTVGPNVGSVLALYRDFELELSRSDIDLTAAEDTHVARTSGYDDWRATLSVLIDTTAKFLSEFAGGGLVVLSCDFGGKSFVGTAILQTSSITGGQREQLENVTLIAAMQSSIT